VRKQKPGLTRQALARRLLVSETTIDRLIAKGLPAVGQRGPAKLYGLAAARARLRTPDRVVSTPDLTAALIRRTDALAQRAATRLQELLATHIRVEDAARAWVGVVDEVTAAARTLPDQVVARGLVQDEGLVGLRGLIEDILSQLPVSARERRMAAEPPLPPEPAPVVTRSHTLAAARAQLANLQSRLIEFRGRIVEYHGPGR
jgi:hypothetical protein